MNTIKNLSNLVDVRIDGTIAILRVKSDVYSLITNLDESDNFIGILTAINQSNQLKALLLLNDEGIFSQKAYDEFMNKVLDSAVDESGLRKVRDQKLLFLMNQVINRLIKRIIDFKKLFIVGLIGEVVSPFFGSSLAADFAFGSRKFSFMMAHPKYGLHPGGALPYFLSKLLHHSKSTELLLRQTPIFAAEALQLGLVNEVFNEHNFEEACISKTKSLCETPASTLHITKRLLNFTRGSLNDYLDYELQLINL
jgi:enoyl-CoA hydratase/carnithine racemase